jgi:hypothetical protein
VTRDQWHNIGAFLPLVFLMNLTCAVCIHRSPEFFLARDGHVWLIAFQLVTFGVYLFYTVRFYVGLAPLIAQARQEWRVPTRDT